MEETALTTEEQQIYDTLSDTGKNLFMGMRHLLQRHDDDLAGRLQDVTDAVRQVQAHQQKSESGFIMFIGWLRDVVTHAAETLKSKRW